MRVGSLSGRKMGRSGCRDFDEVFNALQFQVIDAKQRLQIAEW